MAVGDNGVLPDQLTGADPVEIEMVEHFDPASAGDNGFDGAFGNRQVGLSDFVIQHLERAIPDQERGPPCQRNTVAAVVAPPKSGCAASPGAMLSVTPMGASEASSMRFASSSPDMPRRFPVFIRPRVAFSWISGTRSRSRNSDENYADFLNSVEIPPPQSVDWPRVNMRQINELLRI